MTNRRTKNSEFKHFKDLSNEWWSDEGSFKVLHDIKPIRIQYILDQIKPKKLKGLKILDLGCGGGLICESLTKMGGIVTGIDFIKKNIEIAKIHSKKNNLKIDYYCASPENLNSKKKFDIILNMEIVEHVEDINFFINSCSKLLKKNGLMFVATLNKTLKSYMFAIIGAEYILRWLPIGTHDWEKFVRPEDLKKILIKNNLKLEKLDGMNFNIIKDEWNVSSDTSINYIVKSIKL